MADSRSEVLLDTLVTEYKTITTDNGYRNDIGDRVYTLLRNKEQIVKCPAIEIMIGKGSGKSLDSARTVYDETVSVTIYGYVGSDMDISDATNYLATAMESLLTDIKSVTAKIMTKYIISAGYNFNVQDGKYQFDHFSVDWGKAQGCVALWYDFHIRNMTNDFST